MKISLGASSLIFLLCLGAGARGIAQCVKTFNRTNASGDLIRLDGVNISDTQLNDAAAYWSSCSGYGTGFASFTTNDNASASVVVTVNYLGGQNEFCGIAIHDSPTSIRVNLWDTGLTSTNQPVKCNLTDTLAHELGHVLNLDNSTCQGYMMGPAPLISQNGELVGGARSVTSSECSTAGSNWTTTIDKERDGGSGVPPCV